MSAVVEKYGRFLSGMDEVFLLNVEQDIKSWYQRNNLRKSVLIFPPVNNYRRFLIHKTCEEFDGICTFSIGQGHDRRTVLCHRDQLLNAADTLQERDDRGLSSWNYSGAKGSNEMGVEKFAASTSSDNNYYTSPAEKSGIYQPPALRRTKPKVHQHQSNSNHFVETTGIDGSGREGGGDRAGEGTEPHKGGSSYQSSVDGDGLSYISGQRQESDRSTSSRHRERRPDRAVYVPRARRSVPPNSSEQTTNESLVDKPDKSEKGEDNSSVTQQESVIKTVLTVKREEEVNVICSDLEIRLSCEVEEKDDFVECESTTETNMVNEAELVTTAEVVSSRPAFPDENKIIITEEEKKRRKKPPKDDKDELVVELKKAEKEMNRSSRRIMKQTCKDEPVLEIGEPTTKATTKVSKKTKITIPENDLVKSPKSRISKKAAVAVDPETDDWDSMFTDNGDCLDPKLLDELTAAVGKVEIETPKMDYDLYHSKQDLLKGEEFPHVLEVSNFPVEFKTQDLMMLFNAYKESGFDIKWVDDTHALAVFSSSKIAAEILASNMPFVQLKPLAEATTESRAKAKRSANSLQPYRARPETCAALARRLVTGALGVKVNTKKEVLENERRVLREAKERKLLAAKQRDEIWDS